MKPDGISIFKSSTVISYDLYVDGKVVESGSTDNIDETGLYHYTVMQKQNEEYMINVSDEVEKLVITGGNLRKISVASLTDSMKNYIFDLSDSSRGITIDYLNNRIVYTDTNEELTCVSEQNAKEIEKSLTGITLIPPQKVDYAIGEELDINGLKVYKCYSNGEIEETTEYSVEGFDSQTPGTQTISVTVGEVSSIFTVVVHKEEDIVINIDVPQALNIQVGEQVLLDISIMPQSINDSELVIQNSDENIVKIRGSYIEGLAEGTAEISVSDIYNRITKKCTVIVEEDKTEEHTHEYEEPEFIWPEDYKTCTAVFTCKSGDDEQRVECKVSSKTTEPTCTESGKTVYTATAVFEGTDYTDTREMEIAATVHTYSYTDNRDGTHTKTCTAGDDTTVEPHIYQDGICTYCGAEKPEEPVHLPYSDVHEGDGFYDSVKYVYQEGIMTGLNETTFGPAEDLSRAQFAVILYRMEGSPEVAYRDQFKDVSSDPGQFYRDAVMWASSEDVDIITGYTEGPLAGCFGPADKITREQMAVMMYRYAQYKGNDVTGGELGSFPDSGQVSAFAQEAMGWANSTGLITGNDDGTLAPQGTASRAVCATIIKRFMD